MLQFNVTPPAQQPPNSLSFDMWSSLGGIQLGWDTTANFAFAFFGLAVVRPNGNYVALDATHDILVDVTPFVIPGINPLVVRIPIQPRSVKRGHLLILNDVPAFSMIYALGEPEDGRILGLDPVAGQLTTYVFPQNVFVNFFVRATGIMDFIVGKPR